MSEQKIWHSVDEIFDALNKSNCNYIVMRNFECFESGQVFINGHDDIDLLCDDIKKVKKVLDVRRRFRFPTINSYYIKYNNLIVYVDIRFVGDGYYDSKWQENMLLTKEIFSNKIYVPNLTNYFYSLTYHAIFQKKALSEEYLRKLSFMAVSLGLSCICEKDLKKELFIFMKRNTYRATITRDPAIILTFKDMEDIKISINYLWMLKRIILNYLRHFERSSN